MEIFQKGSHKTVANLLWKPVLPVKYNNSVHIADQDLALSPVSLEHCSRPGPGFPLESLADLRHSPLAYEKSSNQNFNWSFILLLTFLLESGVVAWRTLGSCFSKGGSALYCQCLVLIWNTEDTYSDFTVWKSRAMKSSLPAS